ncbi:MAG: anhydro-N-acetylmuramic acid kinase [Comamonadaceae bacterium CG_4_9_14_3_um_filter_60_33]|nr:MAG: anhydro-N-acetylmuramic acid kinase [Comamonadaceae bacterium CG_4_10_14_3_um_filter_60_42]PJB43223.1 MAG: anhydro-N-acetylmuramic acid kinase [Comamonadaceae bacterium CG_4_9_14_3_um_filter_60_33]
MAELFIGLMSGTSLDGVDGVLADFSAPVPAILGHASAALPPPLKAELLALNQPGYNELHRAALAANALMRVYADVVGQLLSKASISPFQISAVGAHGQTVRHQPQLHDGSGYTLQLANPALLAELTQIDVVADFRSRDVAAGGQGAPLVPVFHQAVFGKAGQTIAILNVGGMANLTVLGPKLPDDVLGFDCGPGNALMDAWCLRHLDQPFDANGAWAASGQIQPGLLQAMLAEPFFAAHPPKSTGRDLFNPKWLERQLGGYADLAPADVQATLLELTAKTCAKSVKSFGAESQQLIVCGGGAFNTHLMGRLQALLPSLAVSPSDDHGLPAQQVEATAFAWLARKAIRREALSLQSITGTRGARVLGAIYPA